MRKNLLRWLCLALCVLLLPVTALGERSYLIADSNTRKLTEEELWQWDYESLGYILNEIFARHGYVFESGSKYDTYFRCMPWYTPNANSDNSQACYPQMNSTEWYNERLIKQVRQEMRDAGTTNPDGKSVWTNFSSGFSTLQGFEYVALKGNQKLPVYSAPDYNSYRASNGKAAVSTNGNIFAAGWESGWLLVMYETNSGSVRVGYVPAEAIKGNIPVNTQLDFDYASAKVTATCKLTDDPARTNTTILTLNPGDQVTYLSTFYNNYAWDYVETTINGQTVRGFIRSGNLDITFGQEADPGDGYDGGVG